MNGVNIRKGAKNLRDMQKFKMYNYHYKNSSPPWPKNVFQYK